MSPCRGVCRAPGRTLASTKRGVAGADQCRVQNDVGPEPQRLGLGRSSTPVSLSSRARAARRPPKHARIPIRTARLVYVYSVLDRIL